ncbi:MAG TPA: DUF4197 domain-containing protein, partial [Bacteroidia bacterium]|nr:DUF4197 domain-containing protein [Bacteroidia bacterium]
ATKDLNSFTGKKDTGSSNGLSSDDIVNGLKEALKVSANNSGAKASQTDGFFKDSLIKIPFPPDAQKAKDFAIKAGQQKQVDDFILSVNRAAEQAAVKAAPIFANAILSMSITDGLSILKGKDDAATQYMKDKTSQQLHDAFLPIVKDAIASVNVTKYWTPITTAYNKTTFLTGDPKVNTDLNEYVTQQALKGLFILLAQEELKIRKNPVARVSDILKKVFGSLDKQ